MFCKQCGSEVREDANFCIACGSPIKGEPQNQEAEIKTKEKNIKSKRKNSFSRILLAILCSIMVFVFSFAALTIFTARNCMNPKQITNMLEDVDIEELIEVSNIELDNDINAKDIEKIYHNTSFKDYVEDVADEYSSYILGGKKPKGINAEDVTELVQENQHEIERILDIEITYEDYDDIYEYFEVNGEKNLGILSSEVRTNDNLDGLRVVVSPYVIIALLILAALFIFLLVKTRLNSIDSLIWTSAPVILSSLLLFVTPFIIRFITVFVAEIGPDALATISLFSDNISSVILLNSGITLIIGVLLIVTYIVIKKFRQSHV